MNSILVKYIIINLISLLRFTMCAEEAGGNLTSCKEMGLIAQAFEHVEECNTWDKKTCPK